MSATTIAPGPAVPLGPFGTEQEARATPAAQAVYDAFGRNPGPGKMAPHNHAMLMAAREAAGVELGAYDSRILAWLSGWAPTTCAVIAGLIPRAALAASTGHSPG
jgi:hypothetical protein